MKGYPLNDYKYYTLFRDMVDDLSKGREDMPGVTWYTRKGDPREVTFGRFVDDIRCLSAKLVDMELDGRHVAILGDNSYEWLVVFFASVYCGAVAVCVDIEQPDDTISQMLDTADIDAAFILSSLDDICLPLINKGKKIFYLNEKGELPNVDDLIAEGRSIRESGREREVTVSPEQTGVIVFTSGTTNYSKPVMLSQIGMLTNASDAIANVKIGPTVFTSLPFYHTYGLNCSVVAMLISGARLYINGNMKTVMRDIMLAKPDTMLTVPLMLETIHTKMWMTAEENGKAAGLRKLFSIKKFMSRLGFKKPGKTLDALRGKCFGEIKTVICGGAHTSVDIMDEFRLMGVNVIQGYGITECSPLVSVNRNEANKYGSVGTVCAHSEVKLVDGEILVRGVNVMQGYYKHPELTEEAIVDGWFATGDVGYIDKDGYLFITGRKKNLIVFKNGKKLSPEKLEERIKKIPMVQDVVVYGAVNGITSDDVQVATSIYPNKELCEGMTSYEILEKLQREVNEINKELPLYQQIKMVSIREQEFSKTALQKIKRHLI